MSDIAGESASALRNGRPTAADIAFLVFLVCMLVVVALLGRMTFHEGLKTEASKARAEALVAWLGDAHSRRADASFEPQACARQSADEASPLTWAGCAKALVSIAGPLGSKVNPFSGDPMALVARCESAYPGTAGQILLERISATPAGSAVPFVVQPLSGDERLNVSLNLRVTVCDKGGYPIRIGETEF